MLYYSNIKINLGLHITEKRADGFHNIESVFYPINWYDALECHPSKTTSIENSGLTIDGAPENNLILKAYRLLSQDHHIPPTSFYIQKNIPMGAGLGGGSANAAYTLKALNQLYELNLNPKQLLEYARQLGSDCAFFIHNQPILATEKGDVFSPCSLNLSKYYILLIYPNIAISTPQAYAKVKPRKESKNILNILSQPIENWKNELKNHFEDALFKDIPVLKQIKEQLYQNGAIYASMSGSGSTMYGIFKNKPCVEKFKSYQTWSGKLELK